MQKSEETIDNFDTTLTAVNDFFGDQEMRDALQQSLQEIPQLMSDSREAVNAIQAMADRADKNFQNLEGLTEPLGQRGGELVESIDDSIARLDELLIQLTEFGKSLNSRDGSLGQFVHNPDLYQRLNRAAENFEQLSTRFRPIVEDARVFTDKIARNPGSLTSGVLRPRQSGVKFTTF
jgi:phospholipid/cholesterol/gamma-HCH transport system substrate-binding protein